MSLLAKAGVHVAAVTMLSCASGWLFLGEASRDALEWALANGAYLDSILVDVLLHVGFCAVLWAALFLIVAQLVALARDPASAAKTSVVRLVSPRGNVLTETLIVLPVALLLIMGIAQLALINIAATLGDLAIIQATRSVWVWAPEAQEGRFNVDRTEVLEKTRVQAAAVLAPAASSDFGRFSAGQHPGYTKTFRKTMGAIYGAQLDDAGSDIGTYSQAQAELQLDGRKDQIGRNFSFYLAFDSETFEERTARKLFNAWVHTDVQLVEMDNRIGAKLTYHQPCLMPLVAGIFGTRQHINGEDGYYTTINRVYTLRKQVKPNGNLPRR